MHGADHRSRVVAYAFALALVGCSTGTESGSDAGRGCVDAAHELDAGASCGDAGGPVVIDAGGPVVIDAGLGRPCRHGEILLEDGEGVCDNPGQATACNDGVLSQGECVPGLVCVDDEGEPECVCNSESDGYCPELDDRCQDIDPDCA